MDDGTVFVIQPMRGKPSLERLHRWIQSLRFHPCCATYRRAMETGFADAALVLVGHGSTFNAESAPPPPISTPMNCVAVGFSLRCSNASGNRSPA